MTYCPSTLCWL